jgi:hypothetical protein
VTPRRPYTGGVWQPSPAQWRLIWPLAALLLLAWPAGSGSLGLKAVRWAANPRGTLPRLPPPLSMELGDNGDAVAEHDAAEAEYYRVAGSGGLLSLRLRLAEARDPLDPSTTRQLLIGIGVIGALVIWRTRGT